MAHTSRTETFTALRDRVVKPPLTFPRLPDLAAAVMRLLKRVPVGQVTTFGDMARALGDVRAARWVSQWIAGQSPRHDTPWYRVVNAAGALPWRDAGMRREQRRSLRLEGVRIANDVVAASLIVAAPKLRKPPLAVLTEFQQRVAEQVSAVNEPRPPQFYCGLDAAYPRAVSCVGAAVLLSAETLEVVATAAVELPVQFPYLPGYLAFRELPALLSAWEAIRPQADGDVLCLVDGNGRLHPRRAGVACCFGVLADVPTIGVGKSLLCGRIGAGGIRSKSHDVIHNGERIGICLSARSPLYVSVGHRISLAAASAEVQRCLRGDRLPAPTAWADRLSHGRPVPGGHSR